MKDLFIDNNLAKNFCTPIDKEFKKLLEWIQNNEEKNNTNKHALVISAKLFNEYVASTGHSKSPTNIVFLVNTLIAQGRIKKITNQQIKDFKATHYKKSLKLLSNAKDQDHIPTVFLSDRKYVLTADKNFTSDLTTFPGFTALVSKRPENLPY